MFASRTVLLLALIPGLAFALGCGSGSKEIANTPAPTEPPNAETSSQLRKVLVGENTPPVDENSPGETVENNPADEIIPPFTFNPPDENTPAASEPAAEATAQDRPLRPIHWWIGNLEHRAQAATAELVASWSYWPLDGVFDVNKEQRRMRLLVGGATSIDAAIEQIGSRYQQGFRTLATNHENWSIKTTAEQAQAFEHAISSCPELTVLQWNHWMTWDDGARPILESAEQLELVEMTYPTAEGKQTYDEMYAWIMSFMQQYSQGKQPGIGLSVYTAHDSATPIGWELMKTQIDAAKAVGAALGSSNHPIGIYISNAEPSEFTVDDVNNYIIYGTRNPATR